MDAFAVPPSIFSFLQQERETDFETLIWLYTEYLLRAAEAWSLPVSLDRVIAHHGFIQRSGPLTQRGFLLGNAIFTNGDDPLAVQRFSRSHELMEALFAALQVEQPSRLSINTEYTIRKNKERWCEQGAAELLMPAPLFFPVAEELGVSLASARALAEFAQTSLTATIRRMLDADIVPAMLLLLRKGHKKSQIVPSQVGQSVLWGAPGEWDPPTELRVWKRWGAPQIKAFVCPNESVSQETSMYKTYEAGIVGDIVIADEVLDLEYIKGPCRTESMLVQIEQTPTLMVLVELLSS